MPRPAPAADLALFDDGPQAERLRRYEASCHRLLFRALDTLERLKAAAASPTPAPRPAATAPRGPATPPRRNEPGAADRAPVLFSSPCENEPGAAAPAVSPRRLDGAPRPVLSP